MLRPCLLPAFCRAFGLFALLLAVAASCTDTETGIDGTDSTTPSDTSATPSAAAVDTAAPEPSPVAGRETATVTGVIDGDTIDVEMGGQTFRVRYIGIDTPESTTQRDCYGKEAARRNGELVAGQTVELEKDVSDTDQYGRLVRYVYVDGAMVNETLAREGYALTYTFPPDVKYSDRFVAAQEQARNERAGLWSACVSVGESSLPACAQTGGDCDCSHFATHADAQTFFESAGPGDPHKLDNDGDGLACESLP